MTRKDYELITLTIGETLDDMRDSPVRVAGGHQVARRIASVLAKANPAFDRDRFLAACGVTK